MIVAKHSRPTLGSALDKEVRVRLKSRVLGMN